MTKDSNEKDTQSSSFRDQILRDLEELKNQRLQEEPLAETNEEIRASLKAMEEAEGTAPSSTVDESFAIPKQTLKIDGLDFPGEYLAEETATSVEEQDQSRPDSSSQFSEEPVVQQVEPQIEEEFDNTVERNLAELRNLAAAAEAALPPVESTPFEESSEEQTMLVEKLPLEETPVEEAVEQEVAEEDLPELILTPEEESQEVLDDTIIAPQTTSDNKEATGSSVPRRRSGKKHSRKKQDKTAKRIVAVVVAIVIIALSVTGFVGYTYVKSCLDPINAQSTENVQVEIPEGSSTLEIGQILVDNKLIKNATVFNYYSKLKSYNNYQSGFYNLNQSMSLDDIAKTLQEAGTATAVDPIAGKVLIVEGYTINQIAEAITLNSNTTDKNDKTPFKAEDFLATVKNPEFINRMVATYPNLFATLPAADSGVLYQLEGYLFPAVYDYTKETTIEDLVEQMIATMDNRLQPYYSQLEAKGLNVNELLTLASLVEKEGSTDEDRRNIASVFYNRINNGMPLQSNIAILYAMGKLGQETTLAEDAAIDTSIASPYNIYLNTGLMPGPVDSPSLAAIDATFNANKTEYFYFVADVTTGTVYFSTTIEEHNENVEKYVNSKINN